MEIQATQTNTDRSRFRAYDLPATTTTLASSCIVLRAARGTESSDKLRVGETEGEENAEEMRKIQPNGWVGGVGVGVGVEGQLAFCTLRKDD
ncbi:unnamed protein product [Mesocestoides corti]|uniref:PDZ domain-containing protein n=1 Tax=Mesocestoides corti TaxID=53468 RepID=A0A0R3UGX7_MESCO|nr:unnamed protein product [Mesocestoides corti]